MNTLPPDAASQALRALLADDFQSVAAILAPHLPASPREMRPELFAKRTARQLICLAPDSLLRVDWSNEPELEAPYARALAKSFRAAYETIGIEIASHRFAHTFSKPAFPAEALESCERLFSKTFSNPKLTDVSKKNIIDKMRWRWALDQLLEAGVTDKQSHAIQSFLLAARSHVSHSCMEESCQTLRELIAQNTRQARLAIQWLAILRDQGWSSPSAPPLLLEAKARQEAMLLQPCTADAPPRASKNGL